MRDTPRTRFRIPKMAMSWRTVVLLEVGVLLGVTAAWLAVHR